MDYWKLIESFWEEYGYSFIMLFIWGVVAALMIEYTIKVAFDSLIAKSEDKKPSLVKGKAFSSLTCGVIFSIYGAYAVMTGMVLPGGKAMCIVWFSIVYLVQFLFSMYGIKYLKNRKEKPKKEKTPKPKTLSKRVQYGEGQTIYKKLEDGTFVEV